MDAIYTQTIPLLFGLIIGLWLRRLVRGLLTLAALAGIAALATLLMGRGRILEANHAVVPQAMVLGAEVLYAIKPVLIGTPGAIAGLLLGVAIFEVAVVAKS